MLHFVLVAFQGAVVPYIHDGAEHHGDDERHPASLLDLVEDCTRVHSFDGGEHDQEQEGYEDMHAPDHDHHHGGQERRHEHHHHDSDTCAQHTP